MSTGIEWQGLDTVELFKEFYSHVYTVKKMIMAGVIDWQQITTEEVSPDLSDRDKTQLLAAYVKAALNDQMEYVSANTNALEFSVYQRASYLMSALADEIFLLQISWFGAPYWNEFSIESGVFETCHAGDEYYRRLQALMDKEVLTGLEKQLAMIYIMTLQLGFRGSLRGHEKAVLELRHKLLPLTGHGGNLRHLFPSAYAFVRNPVIAQKLEPFANWNKLLFFGLAAYLVLTSGVWWWLTSNFSNALSNL